MTAELRAVADECGEGRLALVTEGGYDLASLAASLDGVIEVLAASRPEASWPTAAADPRRGRVAVAHTTRALAPFWALP
jgi:acetoin utilization deacetylase AcuC-like enzyme